MQLTNTDLTPEGRDSGEEEVGDDAHAPHVRAEAGALLVHDLGRHELGLAVVELDGADDPLGEGEVGDLDVLAAGPGEQNVARSQAWREIALLVSKEVLRMQSAKRSHRMRTENSRFLRKSKLF